MSTEQNKATIRRYIDEPWNKGNLDILDELCAPNFTLNGTASLADFKKAIADARRALPDLQIATEEMIAEGDNVVWRWRMRGTHRGEYQGAAPTGKTVTFTGITIARLANGKIVEDRFESSSPSFEQQVSEQAASK
jgi:predicted ester cyclase